MKRSFLVMCVLFSGWPLLGQSLSTPVGLYNVDVAVEDQTAEERERAAQAGLLAVLTRLTGLTSIPRSDPVKAALADSARYYDEFVFVNQDPESGADGMLLRISYQRQALLDLVRRAQLPIWWTRRPKVMAWIVVEELGERIILDAHSDHPLRAALTDAAARRGVAIEFPLMDLEDHLKISEVEIWGHSGHALDERAAKYDAQINLVGRVETELSFRGRSIAGDWTFWLDQERVTLPFSGDQYDVLANLAVDELAGELMERYSVADLGSNRWEIKVSGLHGGQAYADMMNYLSGLDFVEALSVKSLQADVVTLILDSTAQADQLLRLLVVEDRLAEDSLYLGRGVRLLWRG